MESNKDEALRCLSIAQRHRDAGNFSSALKFCQKSVNLFSTPEAVKLLSIINSEATSSASAGPSSATGAETHPSSANVHQRHVHSSSTANGKASANGTAGGIGGEKREYTPEQYGVVKRVRKCKVTEYYEILEVKKDCEEAEVKKAYRKVTWIWT
jgi:DnaJ family protein B protein 12